MPQARKSARSSSRTAASFKEPAALKRLTRSLDAAQKSLEELRSHAGRDAAVNTRALHKGVGKFLSDARRDAGKFTTALKRDFDKAQKAAKSAQQRTGTGGTAKRAGTRRAGTSRGSASRTSGKRASASRGTRKSG
jgi:hypothetical protein